MDASGPAHSQPGAAGAEQLHPALATLLSRKALLKSRFKLVEFLDMGGFATVFRCLDTKSSKEVRKLAALGEQEQPSLASRQLARRQASQQAEPLLKQACQLNCLNAMHLGYCSSRCHSCMLTNICGSCCRLLPRLWWTQRQTRMASCQQRQKRTTKQR
jgi:hypothetical protein